MRLRHALFVALVCGAGLTCRDATAPTFPRVTSIALDPLHALVVPGGTVQLQVVAKDAAGDSVPAGSVRWRSSDTTVAAVSARGLVRGLSFGTMTVTATVDTLVEAASIDVVAPIDSVAMAPNGLAVVPTGRLFFTATPFDSAGDSLTGRSFVWRSSDTAVLGVTAGGAVTARALGSAAITATGEDVTGTATATVRTVTFSQLDISEFSEICGATMDSVAFCWNETGGGGLGVGPGPDGATPVSVATRVKFRLVTGGEGFACGLATSGAAYCWGWNGVSRLGNGLASGTFPVPMPVVGGLTFTTLTSGHSHTCGLTSTGDAYCWGSNGYGDLGTGTAESQDATPVAVTGGIKFRTISAGVYVTCGLAVDSTAYCWGYNYKGQLGVGDSANRNVPTAVAGGLRWASLLTASEHACGIATTGVAYCWGNNFYGALGTGDTTSSPVPVPVTGGLTFTSISPGGDHGWNDNTCAITDAGAAYCWGYNAEGELGDGTTTEQRSPTPVSGGLTWSFIVAGGYATCGITTTRVTYCWGWNTFPLVGGLAVGSAIANVTVPTRVVGQP